MEWGVGGGSLQTQRDPAPVLSGEKPARALLSLRSSPFRGSALWPSGGPLDPDSRGFITRGDPCRWHPCQALPAASHPSPPRGGERGCVASLFSGCLLWAPLCAAEQWKLPSDVGLHNVSPLPGPATVAQAPGHRPPAPASTSTWPPGPQAGPAAQGALRPSRPGTPGPPPPRSCASACTRVRACGGEGGCKAVRGHWWLGPGPPRQARLCHCP